MNIILIAAIDRTNAIAKEGEIPWKIKDDLAIFKEKTMGHTLLVGRKTYESMGRALPGRETMILTSQEDYEADDALVFHSLSKCISYAISKGETDLYVIGGAEIYKQTMDIATHLYLSLVDTIVQGDTFFPDYHERKWERTYMEAHEANERNEFAFFYLEYERKKAISHC